MKKIIYFILLLIGLYSCKDDEIPYIFPKDYFPAYPESYWYYTDGSIIKVSPGYHKHNYYEELETTETSEEVYVPKIDQQYVYEYAITQNDNRVPLKKLLDESNGKNWVVGYPQNGELKRRVIATDVATTLSDTLAGTDQITFEKCIVVVEFLTTDGYANWLSRETYAYKVGLIKEEIQRDGIVLVVRELNQYHISEDI
jgi:uncharacterized protein YlaN (UPF0358 family)